MEAEGPSVYEMPGISRTIHQLQSMEVDGLSAHDIPGISIIHSHPAEQGSGGVVSVQNFKDK